MILDKQNLFSEDQAITVTAVSTNVIDLGADNARNQLDNEKGDVEVFVQVTTAFSGGTSLKVTLQADDDEAFGSAVTILDSAAIVTASLVAGYQFKLGKLPRLGSADKRYLRLNYTVVGTMSAGKVLAGLIRDRQTANA